jgi:hypothetical protein
MAKQKLNLRYRRARIAAATQVGLIVFGWGVAQFPYLVRPNLTIAASSAPINIIVDIEIACAIGGLILFQTTSQVGGCREQDRLNSCGGSSMPNSIVKYRITFKSHSMSAPR